MATCGNVTNIRIEPVNVFWKMQEQWCFDFTNVTASGIGGQYVNLSTTTVANYAWFDENNTDVDPAPAGKTAIEVNYAASASTTAIASAFATAVNAAAGYDAVVSTSNSNHVIVTSLVYGSVTDYDSGTATTVVVSQLSEGRDFDLGLLDGDIEVTFEETLLEVTAHQSGTTSLADLRQGKVVEVATVLKEVPVSKIEELFAKTGGGSYTPMSGTVLHGWGNSRQGDNTIIQAGKLILHPVRLASNDFSEDLCFWRAYALPESLVFSGENPKTLSVTWKIYQDENIDSNINIFSVGDWDQLSYV
jgi:hypothetical protein